MSGDDGNGQPAARRYVIVDHDGDETEFFDSGGLVLTLLDYLEALPVGGRFTVTRVS